MQFRANDRVSINLGSDGVAQVRLTRPEKMNALDPEMFARIIEAGQALHEMKGLRAVVLSRLRQFGVEVIEAPHEKIGTLLLETYLAIKRAGSIG